MLRTVILAAALIAVAVASEYCNVCRDHTMCLHRSTGPGSKCKNFQWKPLTQADKDAVVDAHNKLRNRVALGQESKGTKPQPSASDMRKLVWDDEVASIAQRWANQCDFDHDKCRKTKDGEYNGQNIHWMGTTGRLGAVNWASAVQSWYNEVKDRDGSKNTKPYESTGGPVTGHYTQVAWAKTARVGCGYADYTEDGMNTRLIVCNYKQAGNFIDELMYQGGQPASKCPSGTKRDSTYTGLCA